MPLSKPVPKPPGRSDRPGGDSEKGPLSRRSFIVAVFLFLVAVYEAILLFPKRLSMWMVVGRRLKSEQERFEAIVAALPETCRFPCGEKPARVVVARDTGLQWEEESHFAPGGWMGRPGLEDVSWLVDRSVMTLTDRDTVADAYASIFTPDDRVAIKVLWTVHLPVLDPILRGLLSIGMPPENISIFDFRQLNRKWWSPKEGTPQLWAREPGHQVFNIYQEQYGVGIAGGKYSHRVEEVGSQTTRFEQVLYDCTALINVAHLKTHFLAETTISLKNHQGSHRVPHVLHASWDVSLALLNHAPPIRDKTRLVLCDATAPLYDRGPQSRNCISTWKYNGILASRDPVALDSVGVSIIAEKRREEGLSHDLPRSHVQLRNAERLRLGRHASESIEVKRIDRERG